MRSDLLYALGALDLIGLAAGAAVASSVSAPEIGSTV